MGQQCQQAGGMAAIIFNNSTGTFEGILKGAPVDIPVFSLSGEDGSALAKLIMKGNNVKVSLKSTTGYAYLSGTSMSAPVCKRPNMTSIVVGTSHSHAVFSYLQPQLAPRTQHVSK